eukprot:IDg11358t1
MMTAEPNPKRNSVEEWSSGRAADVIAQFVDWADDTVKARAAKEKITKREALAKVQAAKQYEGVPIPTLSSPMSGMTESKSESVGWTSHAVQPWTADEERYATTTLASLRMQHTKTRKARSRFAGEPPSSWNV